MQAFLDDAPLNTDRPTLAAALEAAAIEAQRHGRIVVEVLVDGRPAGDDLIDERGSASDSPMTGEVRLVSARPRALVRETLLNCVQALEGVGHDQMQSAELIQSGRTEDALQPLGRAIATWQAIRDALERSTALLTGTEGAASDGGSVTASQGNDLDPAPLGELLEGLAVRLEEMRSALAREDWSALADSLAYEMPEQVEHWKSTLDTLAERLDS